MSSVFSENFRIQNAINFKTLLAGQSTDNTKVYFTFGDPTPWANDASPPQANTSVLSLNDIWRNMIGAKLVTGNDVKHVVPRYNWTANTSYIAYDHDFEYNTQNVPYYVVTSDWGIYKCLANNSGGLSTVEPTQLSTSSAIEETDGYIWKYLYSISDADKLRFLTDEFMPVNTLGVDDNSLQWDVQQDAVAGAIESIKVISGGNGYSNANSISVVVTGDGTGAAATARINTQSNTISSFAITNKGSGYSYASVRVTGTGANAVAQAVISPTGGHGADPLRELGGSNLMVNVRLQNSESDKFPVMNDFRQVSLISNPKERGGSLAANVAYSQYTTIILNTATSTYIDDEIVYQGSSLENATFTGVVDVFDAANNTLLLTNTEGTLISDVLLGVTSGTARFVQSIVDAELKKYTGNLLYIHNITPIIRSSDQTESFQIVFKF